MKPENDDVKRMLSELGRALVQAIAASDDVSESVRKLRNGGYALNLILDCQQDGAKGARLRLSTAPVERNSTPADPAFRLDGEDVSFLRELGIDPTRPGRRPRRSSS